MRDSTNAYRTIYKNISVLILGLHIQGYMFKLICNLKYDWIGLNGVNVFVCCLGMYVCMFRMTNGRLEVRIFSYLREPYHCQLK